MATKQRKISARRHRFARRSTVRGTILPTFEHNLVLVRRGRVWSSAVPTPYLDTAGVMVPKAGAALDKPGIEKRAVFKRNAPGRVFAYSIHPRDPTKVVRESSDGKQKVGKLVAGKFRAA